MECIILFVGSRWDAACSHVPELTPSAFIQFINEHDKPTPFVPSHEWTE
jgi:hypothetical protein